MNGIYTMPKKELGEKENSSMTYDTYIQGSCKNKQTDTHIKGQKTTQNGHDHQKQGSNQQGHQVKQKDCNQTCKYD